MQDEGFCEILIHLFTRVSDQRIDISLFKDFVAMTVYPVWKQRVLKIIYSLLTGVFSPCFSTLSFSFRMGCPRSGTRV